MKNVIKNLIKNALVFGIYIVVILFTVNSCTAADNSQTAADTPVAPVIDESLFSLTDVSGHWAESFISQLLELGVVTGYDDGTMLPQNNVSRAEFIAMLVRGLYGSNVKYEGENIFEDTKSGDWFYSAVNYAREMGITQGRDGVNFDPNSKITREELLLMVVRAVKSSENVQTAKTFKDIKSDYPHKNELNYAVNANLISGYEDNTFQPKNNATRAETAAIISRSIAHYQNNRFAGEESATPADAAKEYITKLTEYKSIGEGSFTYGNANTIGIESYNNLIRYDMKRFYDEKGYRVTHRVSNISAVADEADAVFAKVSLTYDSEYTRETVSKMRMVNLKAENEVFLKKTGNSWLVYKTNERIFIDRPIKLVWEQIYNKDITMGDVAPMKGLEIVSPMWFKVSQTREDNYVDLENGNFFVDFSNEDFVKNAANNNYSIWAMLKTDFVPSFTNAFFNNKVLENKTLTLTLNRSFEMGVDGINLDFENMNESDRDAYSKFVRKAAFLFRETGIITSANVTKYHKYSSTWSLCYDRTALGQAVDYVGLMAYDQNGAGSKVSGSVGDMPWVEDAINLTLNEVPAKKLLLGVPFYARLWEEKDGQVVKSSALTMDTAKRIVSENGAEPYYDETTGQNFATWEKDGSVFKIWLEDERSIQNRIDLMKKYNLQGIAVWSRIQGTPEIWEYIDENF